MIHLKLRTEYSFRYAYGRIPDVLKHCETAAAITDRNGTWGHIHWDKECKKLGIKPLFGVELACVKDMEDRSKQPINWMTFIAKNNNGLKEIYELVELATEKFYFIPRIDSTVISRITDDVIILSGKNPGILNLELGIHTRNNFFYEVTPGGLISNSEQIVITADNYYPTLEDKAAYQMVTGKNSNDSPYPMHIAESQVLNIDLNLPLEVLEKALYNNRLIAESCNVSMKVAKMVKPKVDKTIEELCIAAAPKRGVDLHEKRYAERLERELDLIKEKKFEDYFFVVWDMIQFARSKMLVGPARGSSCGSLVCYLLEITEIDPIKFDLLFERFIDINREDYPDIDIDFPDTQRELVFDYLKQKYGHECVAKLGTISQFKAKSAITDVSKELDIPMWEVNDLKNAIVERSSGDARAAFCIMDTFQELEIGRRTLEKYPELAIAGEIEGHSRHSGVHAAGIIVTDEPLTNYCSIDARSGSVQLDKKDAESIGLLKIDALGLRTLSVIQDTLEQIGWTAEQLFKYRLDDEAAFSVLNQGKFAGIFQYEGYALQSLCSQMKIEYFEDVAVITALARPGPLHCGGTTEYLKRRTGKEPVVYLHKLTEEITKVTYGVVVYQEQVMQIGREVGGLSWEDVSSLRKAMSKSLGKEFFDKYWEKFLIGAKNNGLTEEQAKSIWDKVNTMGSWAFNRSHAIAYGMISYWCMVLKAHFPLQFAAACLKNSKDEDQVIKILRELSKEGYSYKSYDKDLSDVEWAVKDNQLIGGFMNIKGIGIKTAKEIVRKRNENIALTPRQLELITSGQTPFDLIFEATELWGHLYSNPRKYDIMSKLSKIEEITNNCEGEFVFIAKVKDKNLRDHNETGNVAKRGGRLITGPTQFLNFTVEDDTSSIICTIGRFDFERIGRRIIEEGKEGDYYLIKGFVKRGFRKVNVKRWKKLTGNDFYNRS